MAQFVETIIRLVDDMDGTEGAETIEFTWDGKQLVIDLNEANATWFRESMAPFVKAARLKPKPKTKPKTARPVEAGGLSAVTVSSDEARMRRDKIRRWGRRNGFEVSNLSKIPQAVVDAYEAAHTRS
jgi:Lsr2